MGGKKNFWDNAGDWVKSTAKSVVKGAYNGVRGAARGVGLHLPTAHQAAEPVRQLVRHPLRTLFPPRSCLQAI
jgi:hypothetical protein